MNIFSYVKQRISILDVIREYTTLKQAGLYWKSRCPFHHEKTASFTVSPHKEIFYCFGCHVGGDVIAFVAKIEQCSPIDAVKYLAQQYQVELPNTLSFEKTETRTEEKNQHTKIHKLIAQWCHAQLLKNPHLLQYLHKRGFNRTSITYFMLGYFPGGSQAIKLLLQAMEKQQILPHDLLTTHIVCKGKTVWYSPFEGRLIFPITNHLGHYCGFGGRTFKEHDERPKYYNSRENNHFIKGNLLFGLDHAKKCIQETGIVFLVEGYTDCIAMVQHGFVNTVAILGTACTLNHLKLLARYAQKLYVLYDGDNAGTKAMLRLTELCWQANMELNVVSLPSTEDPASFLARSNDLQALIRQAKDIFFFFIDTIGKDFSSKPVNEKVQTARSFLQTLATIDDQLKQDILLQKSSNVFNIPFESLKRELETIINKNSIPIKKPSKETSNKNPDPLDTHIPQLEKLIFCAILHNVQLLNGKNEQYLINHLSPPLSVILKQLKLIRSKQTSFVFSQFFDQLSDQHKKWVSRFLLDQENEVDEITFKQLIDQWQKQQWKKAVQNIKVKLIRVQQEGNEVEKQEILNDFFQLKKRVVFADFNENNPITEVIENNGKKEQSSNRNRSERRTS